MKFSTLIVVGGLIALNVYIFNELYQSLQSVETKPLVVDTIAKNPPKTDLFLKATEPPELNNDVADVREADELALKGSNTPSNWSKDVLVGDWEGMDRFGSDGFFQLNKDGRVEMVVFGESFRGTYKVKEAELTEEEKKALKDIGADIPKTLVLKVENRKLPLEYSVKFISKNKLVFTDKRGESIVANRNGYPVPRNTAEERVIDFLVHLTRGELTEAYEFLTENKQETMGGTSEIVLQELILGEKAERMIRFHVKNVNADEKMGVGTAKVEVVVRNITVDSTKTSTIVLQKVGGIWRINNFQP